MTSRSHNNLKRVATIVAIGAMLVASGCGLNSDGRWLPKFDLSQPIPWAESDEPEPGVPVRMVSTWVDAVRHESGVKAERGFGGRIMFYGNEDNTPIAVDGQLVVYAFDETGRNPTDNRPTRRFVFPPGQLAQHLSRGDLGASYSVWLPWDEVGGSQTRVSLICRFEPRRGPLIVSDQATQLLPGTMLAGSESPVDPKIDDLKSQVERAMLESGHGSAAPTPYGKQASYVAEGTGIPADTSAQEIRVHDPRQMTTTSISLPSRFRREGPTATVRGGAH